MTDSGPTQPSTSVLIVDDERSIRTTLSAFLSRAGYEAETAADAVEAKARLAERAFDIVLTDVVMSPIDGLTLMRHVRTVAPSTPVLIMTGEPTVETAVEAVRAGALDYLTKPVNRDDLLKHIGYAATVRALLLEQRRLEEANERYRAGLEELVAERTESLLASDERLVMALEAAQAVAWEADIAAGTMRIFGSAARVFGRDEMASMATQADMLHGVHPDDRAAVRQQAIAAIEGGGNFAIQFRVLTDAGELRWIGAQGQVLPDDDGQPARVTGIARDITEQHRLQTSLAQSDRLTTMGMLAAGVAHEINNPLSYLLYHLESLAAELPDTASPPDEEEDDLGPVSQRRRAQEALAGALRIRQISRALGAFSRVEDMDAVPVRLQDAIAHACRMAQHEVKYRAQLEIDIEPDLPPVMATEGRLAQVVLNLLINAAHAIEEGHAAANRVLVRAWHEGDRILASVQDTGTGMTPEVLERVFEPFYTTKPVGIGSGLGLPICRDILARFGGEISATSEPGVGTRFELWLPCAGGVSADTAPVPLSAPALEPPPAAQRGRAMVIDDDAGMRRIISRSLRDHYHVVAVASGTAALAILAYDQKFDLLVCDVMMPEMQGIDVHAELARHYPDLARRVVFISGGAFTPRARAYLAEVDNVCLAKPIDREQLLAAAQAVERHAVDDSERSAKEGTDSHE